MNMYDNMATMKIIIEQRLAELRNEAEIGRLLRQGRSTEGSENLWQQLSSQLHHWYKRISHLSRPVKTTSGRQTYV